MPLPAAHPRGPHRLTRRVASERRNAGPQFLNPVGQLAVKVAGSNDRVFAWWSRAVFDAAEDSALAFPEFVKDIEVHSRASWICYSEDVLLYPLFQNPKAFSSFSCQTALHDREITLVSGPGLPHYALKPDSYDRRLQTLRLSGTISKSLSRFHPQMSLIRMKSTLSQPMALRRLGIFLAFVVCATVFASEVSAGCGHYVVLTSERDRLSALTDLQIVADLTDLASRPPLAPARDLPCSGPSCSRNPLHPEAPIPPAPVRSDSWCCTSTFLPITAPEPADGLGEPAPVRPLRRASAIERPPRTPHLFAS